MKYIGMILLTISLTMVKSNVDHGGPRPAQPRPRAGLVGKMPPGGLVTGMISLHAGKVEKDSKGNPGRVVTGRMILNKWWLEGPFFVKRPNPSMSLPMLGAGTIKRVRETLFR